MRKLTSLLFAVALAAGCGADTSTGRQTFDILIAGGQVADGSGGPLRAANIGIAGGRIASMDAPADAAADRVIDATGLLVAPGFIDPHTHALEDLQDAERALNLNYLLQGVTTVIVGNDGGGIPDLEATLATFRQHGTGTHVAFYAGHNDIRRSVMGLEDRPATEAELDEMRDIVAAQMEAGALGLSTGLYYTPGSYASTDEVIELARVAARYGGNYDSHMRDESSYSIGLLGAVDEVITVAEEAGIPVHIAHLKALGRDVWGQSGDVIARVEAARERGLRVTADQYPYPASGTSFSSSLIPAWVRADSREAMFGRIENPDLADGIREEMEANLWRRGGAESLLVTGADSEWRGMTLEEIAGRMDTDPISAAIAAVAGGDPSIASFNMNPDDIAAIAIQDWVMTGSDGSGGHPRKYGTYPTVYRDMVLRDGLFNVATFVARSSGRVADALGLCDRGRLETGRQADVIVIDLETYAPGADFQNPTGHAAGVVYSVVGGRMAIDQREATAIRAGSVVDRQQLDCP